jgi:hypothetical protein
MNSEFITILTILWFIFGLAGVHIGNLYDLKRKTQIQANTVWFAIMGPITLIIVIIFLVLNLFEETN